MLVCAPVQRPGREMLQTQAVAEPGDLVPVVCEADYLLSSPPFYGICVCLGPGFNLVGSYRSNNVSVHLPRGLQLMGVFFTGQ